MTFRHKKIDKKKTNTIISLNKTYNTHNKKEGFTMRKTCLLLGVILSFNLLATAFASSNEVIKDESIYYSDGNYIHSVPGLLNTVRDIAEYIKLLQ